MQQGPQHRLLGVLLLASAVALLGCGKPREVKRLGDPEVSPSASARAAAAKTSPAPAAEPTGDGQPQARAKLDQRRRYRVLALGDSITDERVGGGGYLRELRRACPMSRFDHFGRGGDMVSQMRRRLEQELPQRAESYDTLIVYGGVNDLYSDLTAGRSNDHIEADLSAIYRAAKDRGLSVVGITVSPWGGFRRYFNERRSRSTRLLNAWILGTTSSGQTDVVVDSYGILSCGDPERLCPKYENSSRDGLHPGPEGHAVLGQALLERAFPDCE